MKISSVRKNAVLNTAKQLCQILFPIVTIPYVTRILGAQNYGKINFSNSIVNYFVLLASLGINSYAIREGAILRENETQFKEFSNEVFSINVLSTVIAYVLLLLLLLVPQLIRYRKLIVIQSLTIILTTIGADWINSVYEDYLYISVRYIIFQLISLLLLFSFVHEKNDYLIYAFIMVIATAGGNVLNVFYIRKYTKLKFTFHIDWKKHLLPILILFGNQIAITIYVNSDITMLGFLSNERSVGWYSLASKIYTVLQQMLNAILIVAVPRLSYYLGENNFRKFNKLILNLRQALLVLIVPLMIFIFSFSDIIMDIVGGKQYIEGNMALRILAITIPVSLLAALYTNCILLPHKLEQKILLITSIAAIINILLNIWLIPYGGATGAAITTLISEMIVAGWSYRISLKIVGPKMHMKNYKEYFSLIMGGLTVAITCYVLRKVLKIEPIFLITVSLIMSVIVYVVVLLLTKNPILYSEIRKYKGRHY
ncbi:flippase [Limosilactobacillus allomucosae]|uniref:flippase n=1 Tax=Limosilactobacillus allomucosae TaxID=3142938 RepID=UPI003263A450